MKKLELEVLPSGSIRTHYSDEKTDLVKELVSELGGKSTVKRASQVEWEDSEGTAGWTVRANHDPELAIRFVAKYEGKWFTVSRDQTLKVVKFTERSAALEAELTHFWELLPQESVSPSPTT